MKLNFAIIGCGKIAARHAVQIARLGVLKAVCDTDIQKANILAKQYNATAYQSLEALLQNEPTIDVVSICTPNGLHAAHTLTSLRANKHVLCEKPMSIHVADGEQMIAAAKASGKKLFVVKSTRYNPIVLAVKKMIAENMLGQIYSFELNCVWNRPAAYYANSWKGTADLDGGTLFTQFSHYIDVILWFFGEAKTINGYRLNAAHADCIAFEDTGILSVEMHSCALGAIHYSVNAVEKNQEVSLTIVAEKGTLKIGGAYLNELISQQPDLIDIKQLDKGNESNDYGFYKGSMSNHDKVYDNVVRALAGEDSSFTDGEDALKTVAFIENFYNNTPVKKLTN